jgi:hypothetical protein
MTLFATPLCKGWGFLRGCFECSRSLLGLFRMEVVVGQGWSVRRAEDDGLRNISGYATYLWDRRR